MLPELLEAGGAYRDLTKGRLGVLVETLQPQVEQLASVLSVELSGDENYIEMLTTAHERMSSLSEEFAGQFRQHRSEDEVYTELLNEAQELTMAMKAFLEGKQQIDAFAEPTPQVESVARAARAHAGRAGRGDERSRQRRGHHGAVESVVGGGAGVPSAAAGAEFAADRDELPDDAGGGRQGRDACGCGSRSSAVAGRTANQVEMLSITAVQLAAVLPDCERRQAVAIANEVLAEFGELAEIEADVPQAVHTAAVSAGVATVAAVPKNFDPWRLVESAERCLYAARSCNTNTVKSIETR